MNPIETWTGSAWSVEVWPITFANVGFRVETLHISRSLGVQTLLHWCSKHPAPSFLGSHPIAK